MTLKNDFDEDTYSDPEDFPGDLNFNHDDPVSNDDFFLPEEEELPKEE